MWVRRPVMALREPGQNRRASSGSQRAIFSEGIDEPALGAFAPSIRQSRIAANNGTWPSHGQGQQIWARAAAQPRVRRFVSLTQTDGDAPNVG